MSEEDTPIQRMKKDATMKEELPKLFYNNDNTIDEAWGIMNAIISNCQVHFHVSSVIRVSRPISTFSAILSRTSGTICRPMSEGLDVARQRTIANRHETFRWVAPKHALQFC